MKRARFLLAEHGETAYDKRGLVHGDHPVPLSAAGRRQAASLGQRLARSARPPDEIRSSPLRRAHQTSQIVGRALGIPVTTDDRLRSLDVGRFAGQDEKKVAKKLEPFFAHPDRRIPGGETVRGFWARVHAGAQEAARSAAAGKKVLVVTHSNDIGAIEAKAKGTKDGLDKMAHPPKNGSVRAIRYPVGRERPRN